MAILNNSNAISPSGYDVNNSLRFRSSASAYLNRTPASAGNRQIMTYSFWVKRGAITGDYNITNATTDASNSAALYFNSSNSQSFDVFLRVGGTNYSLTTSQVFRDPSAWYHIVVAIDTTQATASNREKVYVNGTQVTAFSTASYVPQNSNLALNNNVAQYIGYSNYFDGYLAEFHFIDGSAKAASDFGETDATTGVWKPKAYTGTYGTNGFYLKFSDIATTSGSNAGLGKDFSGNTNYWTTNNISVTSGTTYDAMKDSPTNTSATVANYCVFNPLGKRRTVTQVATFSEANLKATFPNAGGNATFAMGTLGVTSGKWYWEVPVVTRATEFVIGIGDSSTLDEVTSVRGYQSTTGTINGFTSNNGPGATYTSGDTIGVALDIDAGTCAFYKNNVLQATGTGLGFTTIHPFIQGNTNDVANINCGQRPFTYTPPTGFQALCTTNLPTPTILQGNKYMDATLYSGTGASQVIVNQAQFKPDLVWIKSRNNITNNNLTDSVRGITKIIFSNSANAEATASVGLTSFDSNGFSLATGGDVGFSASGYTYVGWQWQAGQGSTSSNTSGSITSTVSVNTTAGFSIVTYTGTGANATVGHGLGVAPSMIITKYRGTESWAVYHKSTGNTQYLVLNATSAAATASTVWQNTSPTSTVFSVGTAGLVNTSGGSGMVAYCWAEIAGFSRFGSYTGNGSTDGPFVYLGFRPKFILWKRTSTTSSWVIWDTSRSTYNAANSVQFPDTSDAESTNAAYDVDVLSNGFKMRTSNATMNGSGSTYIFAAFAENPFKNANAR